MIIPQKYQEHTAIISAAKEHTTPKEGENEFFKILEKTKNLSFGDGKEFLSTLSNEELKSIENYKNLKNPINIDLLSEEGATNLLVKSNEILDYDGDYSIDVGEKKVVTYLHQDMPNDLKRAILDAKESFPKEYRGDLEIQLHTTFNKHKFFEMISNNGENISPELLKPNYSVTVLQDLKSSAEKNIQLGIGEPESHKAMMKFVDDVLAVYKEEEQESKSVVGSNFVDEVRAAGGMLQYVQKLNFEKIEELIKEKREELEAKYNVDDPSISGEERAERMKQVEEALEAFIKDLMKQLETNGEKKIFRNSPLEEMLQTPS